MKNYLHDWKKFVDISSLFISENMVDARITLKYRNRPARGKLSVTNNNKVKYNQNRLIDIFLKKKTR